MNIYPISGPRSYPCNKGRRLPVFRVTTIIAISSLLAAACGAVSSAKAVSTQATAPKAASLPSSIVIGVQSLDVQPEDLVGPMGWFNRHAGTKVIYKNINGGGPMNTAIEAGAVDIAEVGSPPFAEGLNEGIPYQAVYVDNEAGKISEGLVVKKSAGITSVADLRGKTVATPFGSSADYMFGKALAVNHVPASSVHTINLTPAAIGAAWQRGNLVATYIWTPILTKLLGEGGRLLVSDYNLQKYGYLPGDVIVVRDAFAKKYPQLVTLFVEAMIRATNYANLRNQKSYALEKKVFGLPPSQLTATYTNFPSPALQLTSKYFGNNGAGLKKNVTGQAKFFYTSHVTPHLATAAKIDSAVNPTFLHAAVKAVGVNAK